jgi:hypothetical protein
MAGQPNRSRVHGERTCDGVQGRALARAVGTDDDNKATLVDCKVDTSQGTHRFGCAGVKGLVDSVQLE